MNADAKLNKTGVLFTPPIKVFEAFAGIGAQHKAANNLNENSRIPIKFEVVGMCEWDVYAVISYASINCPAKLELAKGLVALKDDDEVCFELATGNFSKDSKKSADINKLSPAIRRLLLASVLATNNKSDIKKLKADELSYCDLLTYSFPCQGISIANMGRGKGMAKSADSTSALVWEIIRLLSEMRSSGRRLPRYLLMENVKELLGLKNRKQFGSLKRKLGGLGYRTEVVLVDSIDFGSIQNRKRVYALSYLGKLPNGRLGFSEWMNEAKRHQNLDAELARRSAYIEMLKAGIDFPSEATKATPKWTPSRRRMRMSNDVISEEAAAAKKVPWSVRTLTCKQDRHPNIGMVPVSRVRSRFITPRQAFMIMGFDSYDFSRVLAQRSESQVTNDVLYRQAGNSISVEVLEAIFTYVGELEFARRSAAQRDLTASAETENIGVEINV